MKISGKRSVILVLGLTFAVLTISLLQPKKTPTANRLAGPLTLLTTPADVVQKPFEIVLTKKDMRPVIKIPSDNQSGSSAKPLFFSEPNLALIDSRPTPMPDLSDLK